MSERARRGFAEAIDGHPFNTVDSLAAEVERGEATVWSGAKSDVFVRVDRGVCEMGPSAGDMDEILNVAVPDIERAARRMGCTEMHVQAGRPGVARVLAPYGYELAAVILRKKLWD